MTKRDEVGFFWAGLGLFRFLLVVLLCMMAFLFIWQTLHISSRPASHPAFHPSSRPASHPVAQSLPDSLLDPSLLLDPIIMINPLLQIPKHPVGASIISSKILQEQNYQAEHIVEIISKPTAPSEHIPRRYSLDASHLKETPRIAYPRLFLYQVLHHFHQFGTD